jgi:hypothetical protein
MVLMNEIGTIARGVRLPRARSHNLRGKMWKQTLMWWRTEGESADVPGTVRLSVHETACLVMR